MASVGDAALVRRAQAGDREAFACLIDRHLPLVLVLCRRLVGATPLAEDAAQEAVVQAMLHLDRLRQPDRFGPWLAGIGLNLCRLGLRERSRDGESWEALVGGRLVPDFVDAGPDPAELAAAADLSARVRAAVMALPPGQRAAVLLYYLAGLSQAEVAATLGVEPGAVKTRLHKARRALRAQLLTLWMEEMMTETKTAPVEMRIWDVRLVQRKAVEDEDVVARWVIILEEVGGERLLPIWVSQSDAQSLVVQLEGIGVPRPGAHDFTANILRASGVQVREVVIERLVDEVFYATVVLAGPDRPTAVDARPSDALNLASRIGAPIRARPEVLVAVGVQRAEAETVDPSATTQRRAEIATTLREQRAEQEFLARLGRESRAHLVRMTPRFRRVLGAADEHAAEHGHTAVDQIHLLLGVAVVPGSAGLEVLSRLGLSQERLRAEVESILPPADLTSAGGELRLTPTAEATLESAAAEMSELKQGWLGVEHLVLGLLRTGEGQGYQLLSRLGVRLEDARAALQQHLQAVGR